MDELDKGLEISLRGQAAEQALERFAKQIAKWRIALPPTEPLVLDFWLADFEKVGLIECWIANETDAGYCGKYLFVFDSQTCPRHRHVTKHETFFVVKGRVRVDLDGRCLELAEGEVLPIPTGKFHSFTGLGPALLLELSMPCEIDDNCFEDPRIPIGRSQGIRDRKRYL